ncbi:MAG: hypothetical protein KDC92_07440 [Bacteroidetes bacterium]|nr:hypothetical protein [Bacteroidota bacterium]
MYLKKDFNMNQLLKVAITDFKLVFRDPSLRIFLVLPALILVVILIALPALVEAYPVVEEYVPIVLMGGMTQAPTMFGFIYCVVFIDEKDTQVAKMYGVVPVSKKGFVVYRLLFPFVFASLVTWLMLVVQPFYELPMASIALLSFITGLVTPIMALSVAVFSKNKMEGMTWYKIINLLVTLPLAAFFIPKFGEAFGIIPTYWMFKGLNDLIASSSILVPALVAFAFSIVIIAVLVRRHAIVHFRD